MHIPRKRLSLVLPCYNEESVFRDSVERIKRTLSTAGLDYELVFVDDKSSDNTASLIRAELKANRNAKAVFHAKNMGRGSSVSDGIMAASGEVVGFIDIDLEVSPVYIAEALVEIDAGADVVSSVRHYDFTLGGFFRNLLHYSYISLADLVLHLPVSDPNGAYIFARREKIIPVLQRTLDNHWFFETELLKRASLAGLKIVEIHVLYMVNRKKRSTVRVLSDAYYLFSRIFWLRKRLAEEQK